MPEISQEELDKLKDSASKLSDFEKKFERLESEITTTKKRAQDAESKLTDFEKEKLELEGDLQGRLDKEIEENQKLKAENKKRKENSLNAKLKAGIVEKFPNLQPGAVDFMLTKSEHKNHLKIDEESESISGIEAFGEACIKDYPWIKSSKGVKPTDNLPPGTPPEDEDLDDDAQYRKELAAADTQAKYDAVRRKWKRA